MNYLKEILMFNDWIETNPLSTSAIALWYALMHINNKAGWLKEFSVAIKTLESKTGLSRMAIYRARNQLVQKGRIEVRERSGNQSGMYKMISLVYQCDTQTVTQSDTQSDTQAVTQSDTQAVTINKTKLNETKLKEKDIPPISPKGESTDDRFEEFWNAYPRRTAKGYARKKYKEIIKTKQLHDKAMSALERYKQTKQWTRDGGQFIPNPSTWINQRRFEDFDGEKEGGGEWYNEMI